MGIPNASYGALVVVSVILFTTAPAAGFTTSDVTTALIRASLKNLAVHKPRPILWFFSQLSMQHWTSLALAPFFSLFLQPAKQSLYALSSLATHLCLCSTICGWWEFGFQVIGRWLPRLFWRAGESVTRGDRRDRELEFERSFPPLTARPNRRRE